MADLTGTRRLPYQALVICIVCALLSLTACRELPGFEQIFMELGIRLPRITELFIDAHNLHLDLVLFAFCIICGGVAASVPGHISRKIIPVSLLVMSLLLTAVAVYAMFLPLIITIEQHGLPQSAG